MSTKRTSMLGLTIVLVVMMIVAGCGNNSNNNTSNTQDEAQQSDNNTQDEANQTHNDTQDEITQNPIVTLEMASGDVMEIELYPNIAPNTVTNFVNLASSGFYDGLIFHRIIPDFMIQGGDPQGIGTGGPGYGIKGEFTSNGFNNELAHEKGVISMARSGDPDSAGSQFFIVTGDATFLDGDYAGFGKVIKGIELLDTLGYVKTGVQDKPVEDQVIKTMTVETFGFDYGEPEKVTS